jgi:hypothetical protein
MPAPLKFNETVAREICNRMAEGETLTAICKTTGMPDYRVVRRWREETGNKLGDQSFEAAFRQSREDQCHRWADEIVDESQVEVEGGKFDSSRVQAARLRTDAKKWVVSKVLHRIYGDKLQHSGSSEEPITVIIQKFGSEKDIAST